MYTNASLHLCICLNIKHMFSNPTLHHDRTPLYPKVVKFRKIRACCKFLCSYWYSGWPYKLTYTKSILISNSLSLEGDRKCSRHEIQGSLDKWANQGSPLQTSCINVLSFPVLVKENATHRWDLPRSYRLTPDISGISTFQTTNSLFW